MSQSTQSLLNNSEHLTQVWLFKFSIYEDGQLVSQVFVIGFK